MIFSDIVFFQSGNFYGTGNRETFFLKFTPILISGIISTFLALLAFFLVKWKEDKRKAKELKDIREYFFICLERLHQGAKIQYNEFNVSIKKIENDLTEGKVVLQLKDVKHVVDAYPNQLLEIAKTNVFKFFVQRRNDSKAKRIQLFTNLYGKLLIIEKTQAHMIEYTKILNEQFSLETKKFNENLENFIKLLTENSHKLMLNGNKLEDDTYYIDLYKAYVSYLNSGKIQTLENYHNYLFKPIEDITIKKHLAHQDSNFILLFCRISTNIYINVYNNKKTQLQQYNLWKLPFNEVCEILTEIINLEFEDLKKLYLKKT